MTYQAHMLYHLPFHLYSHSQLISSSSFSFCSKSKIVFTASQIGQAQFCLGLGALHLPFFFSHLGLPSSKICIRFQTSSTIDFVQMTLCNTLVLKMVTVQEKYTPACSPLLIYSQYSIKCVEIFPHLEVLCDISCLLYDLMQFWYSCTQLPLPYFRYQLQVPGCHLYLCQISCKSRFP